MFPLRDNIKTRNQPLVTRGLIIITIASFGAELFYGKDFMLRYSLIPASAGFTSLAAFSPFFTSLFLHGGWFHLLSNMWFLHIFGDNVEQALGKLRFTLFYLITGIGAMLTQYAINPYSSIPILGASGAIAGVLGAYLVFYPRTKITTLLPLLVFITVIDIPVAIYLPYWFFLQFFSGVGQVVSGTFASTGGVAFFAHAGGFIIGYALARASHNSGKR